VYRISSSGDQPGHNKDDACADGCGEVGFHSGNADPGKDRSQGGKEGGKDGIENPPPLHRSSVNSRVSYINKLYKRIGMAAMGDFGILY